MSDSPPAPPSLESNQRKHIVAAVAGMVVLIMAFAFLAGGKKTPVYQDTEKDPAVGVIQEDSDFPNAPPDDWLENVPNTGAITQNPGSDPAPQSGSIASTIVTGEAPSAVEADSPLSHPKADNPSTAAVAKIPSTASAEPVPEHATASSTNSPQPTSALNKPASTASATSAAPPPEHATNSSNSPPSVGVGGKPASAPGAGSKASMAATGKAGNHSNDTPTFVRPKTKQPGLIAQTRTLVAEEQLHRSSKKSSPAAAPAVPASKPAPAHVRQEEARAYAQQTTEYLRKQKAVTPSQSVRLPRKAEAPNQKIWREDDTPASADERRPFGLVIVDEKAAVTPEGIPLRTDIPAGTSPLEKTGTDKPLWQRPQ